MKKTLTLAVVMAAGSAAAQIDTITQVIPFDYQPSVGTASPEIELFDTLGGTRELVGVTLSYDQRITFDVQIEQNSPISIEEGNFFADVVYISLHQLGPSDDGGGDDDDGGSGPPFLGPGAAGDVFSPALAPTDGYNGTGSDSFVGSVDSGIFNFTDVSTRDSAGFVLDALTGQGTVSTVLGGFTEIFGGYNTDPGFPDIDPNNPPQGPFFPFQDPFYGVFVDVLNTRHQGTLTVTYDYRPVPAPASLALLSAAGLVTTRRRR